MTRTDSEIADVQYDNHVVPSVVYHAPTGSYRTEFDWDTRPASDAVISAVAYSSGRDPLALPLLYTAIDPDALDRLFVPQALGKRRTNTTVSFEYANHLVTVNGHGTVEVEPFGDPT